MKAEDLKPGQKIHFSVYSEILGHYESDFIIAKNTGKIISWYTGHIHTGGFGKNQLRMAWTSVRKFQKGLDRGAYTLVD